MGTTVIDKHTQIHSCVQCLSHYTDCELTVVAVFLQSACALNCMDKYLKMTQRISQRFQEYQMQQTDMSILAKQGPGGIAGWPLVNCILYRRTFFFAWMRDLRLSVSLRNAVRWIAEFLRVQCKDEVVPWKLWWVDVYHEHKCVLVLRSLFYLITRMLPRKPIQALHYITFLAVTGSSSSGKCGRLSQPSWLLLCAIM